MRALPFLALCLPTFAWSQGTDSVEVYRAARVAEAEYERAARRLAPLRSSERSGVCDEYVGRFCLYYDAGRDPLPAEPPEIARIRNRALDRLRAAFELNPARITTVFPFVRLLLEHKQPQEALRVAEQFRDVATDRATGLMLLTLAQHASGEITSAERTIGAWLAAVDSAERRRLQDIRWLLHSREQKRYRALSAEESARYEARFWRYADALLLTDGNEIRTEHFSRHAESRLIAAAPSVLGSTSWGSDVAELTIRFGSPKARTRLWPTRMGNDDLHITEHWDPEQVSYAAPELDSVLRVRARPATGWPLDTVRSTSGHAPSTIRRMLPLEHQANVFRTADGQLVLRVDGVLPLDSAARAAPGPLRYRSGLFLLDSALVEVARSTNTRVLNGDSLRLAFELPLPDGSSFYSAEVLETDTRLAARGRFPVERPTPHDGLFLSSILIAHAFPAGALPVSRSDPGLVPHGDLVIPARQPFGVFAEVGLGRGGPDSVQVELELITVDGAPAVVRAARWLGERLGLADRPPPRRLTWTAEVPSAAPTPIAVTIDPGNLKPGRYLVEIAVAHAGRRVVTRREIVFSALETSSRRP